MEPEAVTGALGEPVQHLLLRRGEHGAAPGELRVSQQRAEEPGIDGERLAMTEFTDRSIDPQPTTVPRAPEQLAQLIRREGSRLVPAAVADGPEMLAGALGRPPVG